MALFNGRPQWLIVVVPNLFGTGTNLYVARELAPVSPLHDAFE